MLAKLCTNCLRPDSATRRMSNGSCSPFDVSLCGTSELKDLMTVRVTESMATNLIAVVPTSAANDNASESVDDDMHRAAVKQTKARCTDRCQPQPYLPQFAPICLAAMAGSPRSGVDVK